MMLSSFMIALSHLVGVIRETAVELKRFIAFQNPLLFRQIFFFLRGMTNFVNKSHHVYGFLTLLVPAVTL